MKRVRYPAEFKAEAVKQVTERGHGVVYVAKRLGMSPFTQKQLDAIALKLNTRPRKNLGYVTPSVKLAVSVESTG